MISPTGIEYSFHEMSENPSELGDELLKDPSGDIAKLRKIGITDYAVMTYLVRTREGKSREEAMRALLQGRSLSGEQLEFVRGVLERLGQ